MNRYKIAVVGICLNEPYWSYLSPMVESAQKFLLKGHQVDFIIWSDMPQEKAPTGVTIIPQEPAEWPLPTLHRFHLFLREEERLKEYDFIVYCDVDMLFVSTVGDEILGQGLTVAQHPMHAYKRALFAPHEPNPQSTAYIPSLGRIIEKIGKKMFEPLYIAGGFQGGRSDKFIEAMKVMKKMIDDDFSNNYTSIWNDQSYWNAYLFYHYSNRGVVFPETVVLSPSYIMPDSLIKSYYIPIWGRNFVPKIITLTKPFTTSKEAAIALQTKI